MRGADERVGVFPFCVFMESLRAKTRNLPYFWYQSLLKMSRV